MSNSLELDQLDELRDQGLVDRGKSAWDWLRINSRPQSTTDRNINALDGLRGCAVLLVVILHITQYYWRSDVVLRRSMGAWSLLGSGVELFFVLSGFLLFLPYARTAFAETERSMPSTRKYFKRRALRILPTYLASLAIFVAVINSYSQSGVGIGDVALHVSLTHNFLKSTYYSINPVYWTMAVEVQFYLLLPFIAYLLVSALRKAKKVFLATSVFVGIGLVSIGSFGFSLLLHFLGGGFERFVFVTAALQYLPVFSVGIAASLAYIALVDGPWVDRDLTKACKLIGVGAVGLLICTAVAGQFLINHFRYWSFVEAQSSGLAYGGILLGVLLGWRSWGRALEKSSIRFIGMISYSLYIWNLVILQNFVLPRISMWSHGVVTNLVFGTVIGLAAVIPVSLVSYLGLERPFISKRRALEVADPTTQTPPKRIG